MTLFSLYLAYRNKMRTSTTTQVITNESHPWSVSLFSKETANANGGLNHDCESETDSYSHNEELIPHQKIAKIWTDFGVPNPEDLLQNVFNLQTGPDSSSKMTDLCNLFDNELLKFASEAAVAALIAYKYEIHSLSSRLINKKKDLKELSDKLDFSNSRLEKTTLEYDERLNLLNDENEEKISKIKQRAAEDLYKIRHNYDMKLFDEHVNFEKYKDEKEKFKIRIKDLEVSNKSLSLDLASSEKRLTSATKDFEAAIEEIEQLKERFGIKTSETSEDNNSSSKADKNLTCRSAIGITSLNSTEFQDCLDTSLNSIEENEMINKEFLEQMILNYETKIADMTDRIDELEEENKDFKHKSFLGNTTSTSPLACNSINFNNLPQNQSTPVRKLKNQKLELARSLSFAEEIENTQSTSQPNFVEISVQTDFPDLDSETSSDSGCERRISLVSQLSEEMAPPVSDVFENRDSNRLSLCCKSCQKFTKITQTLNKSIQNINDEKDKAASKLKLARTALSSTNDKLTKALKEQKKAATLAKKLVYQNEKLSQQLIKNQDKLIHSENKTSRLAVALRNLVNTTSSICAVKTNYNDDNRSHASSSLTGSFAGSSLPTTPRRTRTPVASPRSSIKYTDNQNFITKNETTFGTDTSISTCKIMSTTPSRVRESETTGLTSVSRLDSEVVQMV